MMDAPKVQSIANAIYTTPRFDMRWHLENAIDRTWAQLIYMGFMCGTAIDPWWARNNHNPNL